MKNIVVFCINWKFMTETSKEDYLLYICVRGFTYIDKWNFINPGRYNIRWLMLHESWIFTRWDILYLYYIFSLYHRDREILSVLLSHFIINYSGTFNRLFKVKPFIKSPFIDSILLWFKDNILKSFIKVICKSILHQRDYTSFLLNIG